MLDRRIAELLEKGIPASANADVRQIQAFFCDVVCSTVDLSQYWIPSYWRIQAKIMALQGGYTGGYK